MKGGCGYKESSNCLIARDTSAAAGVPQVQPTDSNPNTLDPNFKRNHPPPAPSPHYKQRQAKDKKRAAKIRHETFT